MPNNCPFCPLEHKTDWYFIDRWYDSYGAHNIVVCRDLDNKKFRYRLLVVDSGVHRDVQWYNKHRMSMVWLAGLGTSIANAHIANGWAKEIAHIDTEHMKYPDHYHIQICLK